ncbi:hypothetical protein NEOLEDRAFT_1080931 [Neolentinus lepideus HHB14362 ss-1]|uniref:Carbohydrate-binding module family 35 protein n=1 Tax=Neolentinus lepideus HHB14362 ss-1 TaxID=1314782 RepID=A0A165MBA9_9AGAM|nr:hypothetical protein NEOLEDRAFT_1080931 [Neolentinus lepideus HHB14362 ss-1]
MTGPNNLHTLLSFLLAILHYAWPVLGGTNRTIDDQWGDSVTGILPTYLPANDTWQQGANCSSCYSRPNASLAYDGSWHDVSYIPGGPAPMVARFTFDGTAIYVYCILDNHSNYTTLTNLTFRLDNETVGSYVHTPNALSPVFQYGVPVYSNTSIPNGAHTFELETDASDNGSVILFDYLQYT